MLPNEQPIDTTPILAQPREFAQRLARAERERAELIETVARLRAERDDAQAVARAYILRAEAAETKMLREMMDVDVVIAVMAERDDARAEVARLTKDRLKAAQKIELWAHDVDQFSPRTPAGDAEIQDGQIEELTQIAAALRGQPAPERCMCGHTLGLHDTHGYCGECACDTYTAPAKGQE